jgi:hypothetical protein
MDNLGTYAGFGNIEMFPADSDNYRSRAALKVVEGGGSGPFDYCLWNEIKFILLDLRQVMI